LVKIRLQRHGRNKKPYYHIVAADVRTKRDGRIIEDLGRYNPLGPVDKITLNVDRVIHWLKTGAQPTDTVRSILKREGVLYRIHLMGWGRSPEEIEETIAKWREAKGTGKDVSNADAKRARLKAEEEAYKKAQVEKAKAEAEKAEQAKAAAIAAEAEAAAAPAEEAVVEAAAETPAEEAVAEAATEAPAEEAVAEAATEAPAEEAVAEAATEAPAEEATAEESADEDKKEA
jgi:small subunit ribosomal protein S16